MPSKIFAIITLTRVQNYTGFLLSFFPACFGLFLAGPGVEEILKFVPLFFIGSVLTRGVGCIINDICDKDFDSKVERTKNRPLANNSLTSIEAIQVMVVLAICSLGILLTLNRTTISLGILTAVLMMIYPLMKRITNFAQIFLGFTFNMGALIGYTSITNNITFSSIIMYLACAAWTVGYDTIYAFMDLQDDKKIGVMSMARLLEKKNYKLLLGLSYAAFIALFITSIYCSDSISIRWVGLVPIVGLLIWQIYSLDITNPKNCLLRFKSNNYVGFIILITYLL